MHDSHDPLRSLFREAASAGQSGAGLPPVSVIARRGERARRRRIASVAAACLLVLGGTGAALSTLLPHDSSPTLPATTPSPVPPSPVPTAPGASATPGASTSPGVTTSPPAPPPTTSGPGRSTATSYPPQ
ncbi:hypothetical protein J7E99_05630 [Streptomyces sp. ISL-44]|uniref:hypothetical protein n=1 Tax=Streptomyces sp. ISL-44 TaxID=2819184 RepID=UPI001BE9DD7B|nr:hypothetical protein [Streptomyces sp. ISL-44]MBT2540193.1 hypothetical protein [Streptomyces sp. ISL-44]